MIKNSSSQDNGHSESSREPEAAKGAVPSIREQLHRLIIENRDEAGAIDASDQSAMADEIMELLEQEIAKARQQEREKWQNKMMIVDSSKFTLKKEGTQLVPWEKES